MRPENRSARKITICTTHVDYLNLAVKRVIRVARLYRRKGAADYDGMLITLDKIDLLDYGISARWIVNT